MNDNNYFKQKYFVIILLLSFAMQSTTLAASSARDEHYTSKGFFDIHVCNWPNRPLFFMVLFSTENYESLKSISVFDNNNKKLTSLDLSKFKVLKRKGKKDKRVIIKQVKIPETSKNGVYTATAAFKDGTKVHASDHVIITKMPLVSEVTPKNKAETSNIPKRLKWKPVKGAKHYKVFIQDMWQDGKIIFISPLLNKPSLDLKNANLSAGGYYKWKVHARDTNEHILLGDFNHGSISTKFDLSILD